MVGPPGSGKSTFCQENIGLNYFRVSQDEQGADHFKIFSQAILSGKDIVVDRMNHSKTQRSRYIDIARKKGYKVTIIFFDVSYEVCYERCLQRDNHPTIKNEKVLRLALGNFFKTFEKIEDAEADECINLR